ncbi:hypothetical protein CERSUDRAFT_115706 [Gelatoporia subvermispora B]|uniref:Cytochrome P450 n=1 Tax=Ceriporiopsis subvermispora (strain B) TaxID=914234 RepID=M2RBG9_CERS8|nr:hypothetical protein CERSUDRAFT_115706 [Gelatoporia subvermispora B]
MEAMNAIYLSLALVLTVLYVKFHNRQSYPPGPGHVLGLPANVYPWVLYTNWATKHSTDMLFFRLWGSPKLVLSSYAAARALLEERGALYSDRPFRTMSGELVDRRNSVFFISSQSSRFQAYRRLLHAGLDRREAARHYATQEAETRTMLGRLLHAPEGFRAIIRRTSGAVIMKVVFGYPVKTDDDPFVKLADARLRISEEAAKPGWLVDSVPMLKYLPDWFPGANFKRIAKQWRKDVYELNSLPFAWVKEQIANGTAVPSFTSRLLQPSSGPLPTAKEEDIIMWVSSALYLGGTDTTAGYLLNFLLAMMLFPEAQKKAQEELDRVIGNERLPCMSDEASLPYVTALIQEVHRWIPIGPLALAHKVIQDDVYNGYFIPKGTEIITNRWAMLRDPSIYANPDEFTPERFLEFSGHEQELDPRPMVFGFGRRACPGIHMANASIFLAASSILATFNIRKAKDNAGKEIEPNLEFLTGIVAHPKPFKCSITPRSETAVALIESAIDD